MLNKINSLVTKKYGTRRGLMLTYWHRFLCVFGRYRKYRQVDWRTVNRLVFVCKGNICRSAYAEAVAKSVGIECISCGIDTVLGKPANEMAIKAAKKRSVDLSEHKTTPLQSLILKENDLLMAMEPWQVEALHDALPTSQCSLLGLWGERVNPYIHDPYGASLSYFDQCFDYIESTVYVVSKKMDGVRKKS